ncbi:hypothetical protein LTS10_010540 [Elasticomyces elasticus]|nr:hypothetical protein LTS10_010540 [Elasticomyces elasticus]
MSSDGNGEMRALLLAALKRDLSRPDTASRDLLLEHIEEAEKARYRKQYWFANVVCIVNSFGMGKTFATLLLAHKVPTFHIFLRPEEHLDANGIPAGDIGAQDFLMHGPVIDTKLLHQTQQMFEAEQGLEKQEFDVHIAQVNAHLRAHSYLVAVFKVLTLKLEQAKATAQKPLDTFGTYCDPEEVAGKAARRRELFLAVHSEAECELATILQSSKTIYELVLRFADTDISTRLYTDEWRQSLASPFGAIVSAANGIMEVLGVDEPNSSQISLILCWDEVGDLLRSNDSTQGPTVFHALLEMLGVLREYPIWHTFTSTNPVISQVIVLPGNHNGRISSGWRGSSHGPPVPAELPPTFTRFLGNQVDKESTVSTPTVRDYVGVSYQCRFGRVLWASAVNDLIATDSLLWAGIAHAEGHKVISFARQKLFNTAITADILSKPEKVEQEAVALLSTLINLEPGSETSAGYEFVQKQIDQHMRVALKIISEMWILDTTRWPEPILAQAAIEVAKQKMKLHPDGDTAYNVALGKVQSLFRRRVIEQGDIAGIVGRATLMAARLCLDEWFTLTDLFESLLGKQNSLWVKRLPQELQRAQFNWNHFTSVPTEYVHHATDDQKWQYLFRDRQAIQGWKGMPKLDCYLLGYLGDIERDFEFKKLCIVAVSFKHTNGSFGTAKSLDAEQRHFTWPHRSEWAQAQETPEPASKKARQSDALRRNSLETTKTQSKEARPGVKRKVKRVSYRDRFTFIGRAFGNNPMLCVSMDLGCEHGEDGSVQFGYHTNDTDRCGFEGDMYCVDLRGLDKGLYPCVGNSVEALSGLMQHFEDSDRVEHEIMYPQFKWRKGIEEEDSESE